MEKRTYTTLANDFPELLSEWDYLKNSKYNPFTVKSTSREYAWWKCLSCGNEWKTQIASRTKTGAGCPKCARKKASQKRNETLLKRGGSLADSGIGFLDEWDYEKNTDIQPSEITYGSETKVWWKCNRGHSWLASPNGRRNSGCPVCSMERHTSFPEQAIFFYLSKYLNAENRFKLNKKEIDIYLPDLSVGIEYDGEYYHRSKSARSKEKTKDAFFLSKGIRIIRVKESDKTDYQWENLILYYSPNNDYSALSDVISQLLIFLGVKSSEEVVVQRDEAEILQRFILSEKENSLQNKMPSLASEWDLEENQGIRPDQVNYTSHRKVAWMCKKGHKWKATVYSRVSGNGCPCCSGKVLVQGENDLKSQNPMLALEWNYEKNGDLKPEMITVNNGKKVWWTCSSCGNTWQATVAHRNSGRGCPECAKAKSSEKFCRTRIKRVGSFSDAFPDLIKEWDYQKNGDITPDLVSPHSGRKVWWTCSKCNHEWEAVISNRAKGSGCPKCAQTQRILTNTANALKSKPSLLEAYPDIAKEWDWMSNKPLTPDIITPGSSKKIGWICSVCGNHWNAIISNRTRKNQGCPECFKKKRKSHN